MKNEQVLDHRQIIDTGRPVQVKYGAETAPRRVKMFTFDGSDDPNIKKGFEPFIITCSRRDYPELRPYLAQALGAFVTRFNVGPSVGEWSDYKMNPNNRKFREILDGKYGRDAELFVIPLRKKGLEDGRTAWMPEGGVRFVTGAFLRWSELREGTLNLMSGSTRVSHDALYLDFYHAGASLNDYVTGVADI